MRWVICALAVLAFAPRAFADDFDILRGTLPVGPATFTRWSGFYLGGQLGESAGSGDFTHATQAPIAYVLRDSTLEQDVAPSQWPVLGTATQDRTSYGGFIGYNTQFQDLILGLEANYNQASLSFFPPNTPISRISADSTGTTYAINITGSGSLRDLDFGSLRARAGWVLGNFMPYGFAGLALGQSDTSISATIFGTATSAPTAYCGTTTTPPCPAVPYSFSSTAGRNGQVMVGFVTGLGLDVALTPNIFLRGEYEYVQFAQVSGILVDINTIRVGAGLKF